MKKSGQSLIILILIITACGRNLNEAKRYSEMRSESDSLISQSNLVIKDQRAIADSLRKIRDDILAGKTTKYKLARLDKEITNAAQIEADMDKVRKHLNAIKTFAEAGERANKRIIYYKRKYINYASVIQVHDENIMIQEITDGLTAKQYISRYLPKQK
jgi:hypothetical protein